MAPSVLCYFSNKHVKSNPSGLLLHIHHLHDEKKLILLFQKRENIRDFLNPGFFVFLDSLATATSPVNSWEAVACPAE